ncbi:hypothetical protein Clacol_002747 [Clathrus columnatus]|uniref:Major facilitator superfamily (MFS) profile domain-containing protein n=1 Tax=Clathrus columnatus TaxID=1419009 RepID=A0AAV5A709_9AGAM|nr:hypothetical protein Clacol_002747 [Clathrus columnatus]
MPLGILDTKEKQEVPGTCLLSDDPNQKALELYKGVDISSLKHGTGKCWSLAPPFQRDSDIILVPQPSDDPVSADLVGLAAEFNVSVQAMSRALGTALVATLAIATMVWSMLSVTWGKRPIYLASTLIMLIGCIVSGEAKTYGVLLGGRILQGIGQAVLEFLVGSSLAEIYFLHERGLPVAMLKFHTTAPIAGQILQHLNFRWCFRIFSIATLILFILQIFFMPETVYVRRNVLVHQDTKDVMEHHPSDDKASRDIEEEGRPVPALMSYRRSLRVFSGRYATNESALRIVWTPFALLASPTVIVDCHRQSADAALGALIFGKLD